MKALALHQPVAVDLRLIIATHEDQQRSGADRRHGGEHRPQGPGPDQRTPVELSFDLGAMWAKTQAMLRDSIDALVSMDVQQATDVCRRDDEVDRDEYDIRIEIEGLIRQHPDRVARLSSPAGCFPQPGADRRPGHQHCRRRGLPGGWPHHSPRQQAVAGRVLSAG